MLKTKKARDQKCRRQLLNQVGSADICPLSAASSRSLWTLVTAVSVLWYFRYADCVLGISRLLSRKA